MLVFTEENENLIIDAIECKALYEDEYGHIEPASYLKNANLFGSYLHIKDKGVRHFADFRDAETCVSFSEKLAEGFDVPLYNFISNR